MEKKFNVLFLSNMMAEKGVWTLVSAAQVLRQRGLDFEVHFVGKWSDISEDGFTALVREAHLESVCMAHGPQYGQDKEVFWQNADLFVFPTFYHNECFPLVLLEAMQHGIPCISTNEGGIPGIIDDGKTGFLVERQNARMLAEKMVWLMENREECKRMGRNGREKFEHEFTLDVFEKRLVDILQQCIG